MSSSSPVFRDLRLALVAAGLVTTLWLAGWLRTLDRPAGDLVLSLPRPFPVSDSPFAAVVIDEAAVAALGPLPWPRERLARTVEAVWAAGARGLVIDILLADAGVEDGDRRLDEALGDGPVVLPAALVGEGPSAAWLLPHERFGGVSRAAHAHAETAPDGVVRSVVASKQAGGLALPALALEATRLAGSSWVFEPGETVRCDFRVRPREIPRVSVTALLAAGPGSSREILRDRVVFLGVTATGAGDQLFLPTTRRGVPVPGVLVHAAIAASLLDGGRLHHLPAVALAGAILAVGFVVQLLRSRIGRLGAAHLAGLTAVVLVVLPLALWTAGVLLPGVTLLATVAISALVREGAESYEARREAGELLRWIAGGPEDEKAPPGAVERLRLIRRLYTDRSADERRRAERQREMQRRVAHELKTPLASLAGFGELLERYSLEPDELRRVAGLIRDESERLRAMVTGFLEIERLKTGDEEPTTVDLERLLRQRCEVLAGAAATGRKMGVRVTGDVRVRGVETSLARVIDNLVGNALRYAPGGPIEIALDGRDDEVVLRVRDHGPGIPEEALPRLFERFYRVPGTAAHGTGLGLALVKETVDGHGGCIQVDSRPGHGATFIVSLPREKP